MSFPEFCFRGIRTENWVLEDKKVSPMAFEPIYKNPIEREDGFIETSIAWEDDESVLGFCFKNLKNNFAFGAVKLSKTNLDIIISKAEIGQIMYERRPLPENQYHGNILFTKELPTRSRRLIESSLSFFSSKVLSNHS